MLKKQDGFTLVEMLIVMLVVSILLIITIPNVAKTNEKIQNKGCEAYIQMVQSQVQLYELETGNKVENFQSLQPDYLPEGSDKCPNGDSLTIVESVVKPSAAPNEGDED